MENLKLELLRLIEAEKKDEIEVKFKAANGCWTIPYKTHEGPGDIEVIKIQNNNLIKIKEGGEYIYTIYGIDTRYLLKEIKYFIINNFKKIKEGKIKEGEDEVKINKFLLSLILKEINEFNINFKENVIKFEYLEEYLKIYF